MARHKADEFIIEGPPIAEGRKSGPNILVLDTSSLTLLAQPIPKRFIDPDTPQNKRPKTYLDLLKYIPRDVIDEIHVPDVVVLEATGYLAVPDPQNPEHLEMRVVDRLTAEKNPILCDFLLGDAKLDAKPITITCYEESVAFFKKLEEATTRANKIYDQQRAHHQKPGESLEFHKANAAVRQIRKEEGADLGEMTCVYHCLEHMAKYDASVAMMSEDRAGRKLMHRSMKHAPQSDEMDYYILNVRGLLRAMMKTEFLAEAGLKKDLNLNDIMKSIYYAKDRSEPSPQIYTTALDTSGHEADVLVKRLEAHQSQHRA